MEKSEHVTLFVGDGNGKTKLSNYELRESINNIINKPINRNTNGKNTKQDTFLILVDSCHTRKATHRRLIKDLQKNNPVPFWINTKRKKR